MKKCTQCGMEQTDGKFCPVCGAELADIPDTAENTAIPAFAAPTPGAATNAAPAEGAPAAQPVMQQPSVQPYTAPVVPGQKKWYHSTAFIIVMLFLFWPVGMYLMWRHADWSRVAKIIVTVAIVLIVIVNLAVTGILTYFTVQSVGSELVSDSYAYEEPLIGNSVPESPVVPGTHTQSDFDDITAVMAESLTDLGEGASYVCVYNAELNTYDINITIDGGADTLAYLQQSATEQDLTDWAGVKDNFASLSGATKSLLNSSGFEDVDCRCNLVDDTDPANMLFITVNGETTYDALTD